jgi:cold shock CspA family protein
MPSQTFNPEAFPAPFPKQEQELSHQEKLAAVNKNRRQGAKSLDVSSKAFIPNKKTKIEQINQQMTQQQPIPQDQDFIEYKVTGRLKFFNEAQSYGFILSDIDAKDIFFHFDDMKKTALSKQFLKDAKNKYIVHFQFKVMGYFGKYTNSRKAVDIELLKIEPVLFQENYF